MTYTSVKLHLQVRNLEKVENIRPRVYHKDEKWSKNHCHKNSSCRQKIKKILEQVLLCKNCRQVRITYAAG